MCRHIILHFQCVWHFVTLFLKAATASLPLSNFFRATSTSASPSFSPATASSSLQTFLCGNVFNFFCNAFIFFWAMNEYLPNQYLFVISSPCQLSSPLATSLLSPTWKKKGKNIQKLQRVKMIIRLNRCPNIEVIPFQASSQSWQHSPSELHENSQSRPHMEYVPFPHSLPSLIKIWNMPRSKCRKSTARFSLLSKPVWWLSS